MTNLTTILIFQIVTNISPVTSQERIPCEVCGVAHHLRVGERSIVTSNVMAQVTFEGTAGTVGLKSVELTNYVRYTTNKIEAQQLSVPPSLPQPREKDGAK